MQVRSVGRAIAGVAVTIVAVLALGGCGSSTPTAETTASATEPPGSSTAPAGSDMVTIDNFAFGPATLTVAVGSTVSWTNAQDATHTVTADDDSWDSGTLASGATFTHTFDTAGTFAYHCTIHPAMKATIVVNA